MGMSAVYGTPDDAESIATLHRAIELGIDFWDSSDAYGMGKNEELLSRALEGKRSKVFLATKFGNLMGRGPAGKVADGRPEFVIQSCEASLKRLKVDVIDLYYQHRVDPAVPIEDTVGAMKKLVEQGKVRYLGLSEAGVATIRKANSVHPIAALQSEYSLWTRDMEKKILPTCRSLGIAFVAYSPLGRGFLTGAIKGVESLSETDGRRRHPRFAADNIAKNSGLLGAIDAVARRLKVTTAQAALAWVLAQGQDIIPIPGTKRRTYLEADAAAADLSLSDADKAALAAAFPPGVTSGTRYPEAQLASLGI
jgi:aryl-alcohol dehydrogenase-like predicted oxidoreductase